MIRVVLDTNVIASGATHPKGPSGQVFTAWRRRAFTLVVSEHILDELEETLADRYFKTHLTRRERKAAVSRLRRQAEMTEITVAVDNVAPHPEDDQVLATALSAGAAVVVTGDERFRRAVREYKGVLVLSPAEFLEVLRGQ